jgi:carbon storage regulator CsrA
MLVLSRRTTEEVVLPGIETTIQVVGVRGNVVRLGITAPEGVAVYRKELLDRMDPAARPGPLAPGSSHFWRNRLNTASVGLALLRGQLQAGQADSAQATLDKIDQALRALHERVDAAPRPAPAPRRKALLVEDDPNECELLAGFLRLAGLEVTTAGDGCDALDHLRKEGRPDVVLLDMILPRCDGPTTVRAIRSDPSWSALKIFAVSGQAPEHFGLDPAGAGIDRWFRKPLDPTALLRELNRELRA